MRYNFACVLAGHLGDKEAALKMLQSTLPLAGEYQVRIAGTDTDFDSIRDDPRFQKMFATRRSVSASRRKAAVTPPSAQQL